MGRGKVQLKRIENPNARKVTFTKRRDSLLRKAFEFSLLCEVDVAAIIFSSSDEVYEYSTQDINQTISKYHRAKGTLNQSDQRSSTEFMMEELDNMKSTVRALEAKNKHLCGQDLLPLQLKELKKLEKELNTGLDRIRIRKAVALTRIMKFWETYLGH